MKTALRVKARALEPLTDDVIADLCASFEAAACDAVCDRVGRAMALYEDTLGVAGIGAAAISEAGNEEHSAPRHLVVAGGVAANKSLRAALDDLARARGYQLHAPPLELCGDNAAMIAWAGAERHVRGISDGLGFSARARWPLDPDAPPALGAGVKA